MKKSVLMVLMCGWLAGCANGAFEIKEVDTELVGDPAQLESLYGKYEITDAGRLSRQVTTMEISRSSIGKPIFKFYDQDTKQVDVFSPRSCDLSVGTGG